MELAQFVRETLLSVIMGIKQAQDATRTTGAVINPSGLRYNTQLLAGQGYTDTGEITQTIEFDLAITVKEGTATEGKIGVLTGILGLAAQGQSSSQNDQTNRVRFAVPVMFPFSNAHKS